MIKRRKFTYSDKLDEYWHQIRLVVWWISLTIHVYKKTILLSWNKILIYYYYIYCTCTVFYVKHHYFGSLTGFCLNPWKIFGRPLEDLWKTHIDHSIILMSHWPLYHFDDTLITLSLTTYWLLRAISIIMTKMFVCPLHIHTVYIQYIYILYTYTYYIYTYMYTYCMYMYMYMYVYVYYIYVFIYLFIYLYIYLFIHLFIYLFINLFIYLFIFQRERMQCRDSITWTTQLFFTNYTIFIILPITLLFFTNCNLLLKLVILTVLLWMGRRD